MSKVDNFSYPTPIPAKVWGCSLWSRSVMSGSAEGEMVRLISREIIFSEFQPDHDTSTLQTNRRTDEQLALAIQRSATLRAVLVGRTARGPAFSWVHIPHPTPPHPTPPHPTPPTPPHPPYSRRLRRLYSCAAPHTLISPASHTSISRFAF